MVHQAVYVRRYMPDAWTIKDFVNFQLQPSGMENSARSLFCSVSPSSFLFRYLGLLLIVWTSIQCSMEYFSHVWCSYCYLPFQFRFKEYSQLKSQHTFQVILYILFVEFYLGYLVVYVAKIFDLHEQHFRCISLEMQCSRNVRHYPILYAVIIDWLFNRSAIWDSVLGQSLSDVLVHAPKYGAQLYSIVLSVLRQYARSIAAGRC